MISTLGPESAQGNSLRTTLIEETPKSSQIGVPESGLNSEARPT